MKQSNSIDIAIGMSARSKIWKNKSILWPDFVKRIQEGVKTNETLKEFLGATKEEQTKIKDVGGYVGGYIRNGRRNPQNIVHRQLLTLDIDFAHVDLWDDLTLQFDFAMVLHATHKHSAECPRYRLLIPISREATQDEYVAVARKIAGEIGIELFDNTTFETNRLMFWPSCPKDVEYYCQVQEGDWLDVDATLASYIYWKDSTLWPTADSRYNQVKDLTKKQEDPETKKGIIGAFCRTFTISEAIGTFLNDVYVSTADKDRFTYLKGTAAAGLIVYDDKFAYSHHGTDPASGKLCNAFDLVRVHKFGHLDTLGEAKPKSMGLMESFIISNAEVKKTIASENAAEAKYDFADAEDEQAETTEENSAWVAGLEMDTKGNYVSTAGNLNLIFANDTRLKGCFKENLFDNKKYVFRSLPWRAIKKPEPIKNVDFSGVRNYIESIYGIVGNLKIEDAIALEFEKNSFHPIKEYLQGLKWDKVKRIDETLIHYFGAVDNVYTREAIRKMLVGAVARVMLPGVKFDLALILVGEQGTGKSTFIKKLGRNWSSDTFMTVQGKEALEQIQGAWLIEMAELSGLRKAEVESVKHFISKQEDTFRPAYGRTAETYLRQCVFFGTINNNDFLRDPSGNRRFMPIDVNKYAIKKCVFTELEAEVGQLWAEAVELYKAGETLYLSDEAENLAKMEQMRHSEVDARSGLIEQYLDRKLPTDWEAKDLLERRNYLNDELSTKGEVERQYVCIAELWCECLLKNKEDMSRYNTRDVNDIVKSLRNWEAHNSTRNFKLYGKQKYYSRKAGY